MRAYLCTAGVVRSEDNLKELVSPLKTLFVLFCVLDSGTSGLVAATLTAGPLASPLYFWTCPNLLVLGPQVSASYLHSILPWQCDAVCHNVSVSGSGLIFHGR